MKSLVAIVALVLISGCKPPKTVKAPIGPPVVTLPASCQWVTPDEAEKLISSTPDLKIADVRMEEEIRSGAGWIKGAEAASYLHDNKPYLQKWDKDKPWLVYCALGPRSELTAIEMASLGFKKVYLLQGGFNAWLSANKPVQK